jgi:hypothetical protein
MRRWICVVIAALLAGCVAKYRVDSIDKPADELSNQASFYVILPADGAYGGQTYAGSGASTAQAVASALLRHVQTAETGATPAESLPSAITHAKERGLGYVFQPIILHWEDRATEWSGITDKVEFKFSVIDVASGQVTSSSVVHASTKWASFGGDHPQDLLPETAKSFVDQLF